MPVSPKRTPVPGTLIRNQVEYDLAVARLDDLIGAPEHGPLGLEFEAIAAALADYDRRSYSQDADEVPSTTAHQTEPARIRPPRERVSAFVKVRETCSWVAANARYVHIDENRIRDYARSIRPPDEIDLYHTSDHHLVGNGADTVAYFLILDSINFGSGYFDSIVKLPHCSGYYTIAKYLKGFCVKNGVPTARALYEFSQEDYARIFNQNLSDPVILELIEMFRVSLRDLSRLLLHRFEGSYVKLVDSCSHSADRLIDIMLRLPTFQDVERYHGRQVFFYKRAQILVHDLALAFCNKSWGYFQDVGELTIFADNVVAHVLRLDGLLRYDPDLASRIEMGVSIPAGSDEEIEIRACSVHAVTLLTEALRQEGIQTSDRILDYVLWNRGHQPAYRERPRHRTRSIFY